MITVIECYAPSFACDEVEAALQGVATRLASVTRSSQSDGSTPPPSRPGGARAAVLVKRAEDIGCWLGEDHSAAGCETTFGKRSGSP